MVEKLLGLILCGGQSKRFEEDKGLYHYRRKAMVFRQKEKLEAIDLRVKISIREEQFSAYRPHFIDTTLVLDDKSAMVDGPLLGLYSAFKQNPGKDIFLLATDLLNISRKTLQMFIERYQKETDYEAYVFHNGDFYEPLCAIYRNQLVKKITNNPKMQSFIQNTKVFSMNLASKSDEFKNFNYKKDLNKR